MTTIFKNIAFVSVAASMLSLCVTAPANAAISLDTILNTPGVPASVAPGDFSIAVLPDTQYYLAQAQLGGTFDCSEHKLNGSRKTRLKKILPTLLTWVILLSMAITP